MADPLALRLASDRARLAELVRRTGGRVVVIANPTPASPRLVVELRYPTAGSHAYPGDRRESSRLAIDFGARYPFEAPRASVLTPVFHPNVWANGVVCLGTGWIPGEGLDLFVQRIVRLLVFSPDLVNVHSAANPEALRWYVLRRMEHPWAFPAESPDFGEAEVPGSPGVRWEAEAAGRGADASPAGGTARGGESARSAPRADNRATAHDRVRRDCPRCGMGLRLPAGRSGTVRCPGCQHEFGAAT